MKGLPWQQWKATHRVKFAPCGTRYVRIQMFRRAARQTWGGYDLAALEIPVRPIPMARKNDGTKAGAPSGLLTRAGAQGFTCSGGRRNSPPQPLVTRPDRKFPSRYCTCVPNRRGEISGVEIDGRLVVDLEDGESSSGNRASRPPGQTFRTRFAAAGEAPACRAAAGSCAIREPRFASCNVPGQAGVRLLPGPPQF